jgi:hypothetical protein|tara:strand:- start:553 stop:747 length:195 start_codon:yes stop_codon:yes gene_type:complete
MAIRKDAHIHIKVETGFYKAINKGCDALGKSKSGAIEECLRLYWPRYIQDEKEKRASFSAMMEA